MDTARKSAHMHKFLCAPQGELCALWKPAVFVVRFRNLRHQNHLRHFFQMQALGFHFELKQQGQQGLGSAFFEVHQGTVMEAAQKPT